MNRAFTASAIAMLLAFQAMAALAQPAANGPVQVQLESRKVTRAADGREAFAAADAARPGDVIEYAVTYRNTGREMVRNLEATLPIPAHTEFIHGTARPARALASLDAAAFADMPLTRKAVREGRAVDEMVPFTDYRYLRWHVGELGAGKSVIFTARVKVVE